MTGFVGPDSTDSRIVHLEGLAVIGIDPDTSLTKQLRIVELHAKFLLSSFG
ncbi:hypothetical protein D3C78_1883630 [compost metagenome]